MVDDDLVVEARIWINREFRYMHLANLQQIIMMTLSV
jgi:hypothetical protein